MFEKNKYEMTQKDEPNIKNTKVNLIIPILFFQ